MISGLFSSRAWGMALLGGVLLLHLAFGAWAVSRDKPLDFATYYLAGEALRQGVDPYTLRDADVVDMAHGLGVERWAFPYRYPPLTAALLSLAAPLGFETARWLWMLASVGAMALSAWLLGSALGGGWRVAAAALLLGTSAPALATLHAGQINAFVLLCLALALRCLGRGRTFRAGLALGLGAQLKVLPLAFVAWLGWRGPRRAAWGGVAAVASLGLLALPLIGWEVALSHLKQLVHLAGGSRALAYIPNQTMNGALARLLPGQPELALIGGRVFALLALLGTAVALWPLGRGRGEERLRRLGEMISPRPPHQGVFSRACRARQALEKTPYRGVQGGSFPLAAGGVLLPAGAFSSAPLRRLDLEFGLVCAAMLLIPYNVWQHTQLLLLPALAVALDEAWTRGERRLAAFLLGLHLAASLHGLVWRALEPWPWLANTPFVFACVLWVVLWRQVRSVGRYEMRLFQDLR